MFSKITRLILCKRLIINNQKKNASEKTEDKHCWSKLLKSNTSEPIIISCKSKNKAQNSGEIYVTIIVVLDPLITIFFIFILVYFIYI